MNAETRSEATWRAFFMAAINAGVGTVVGMIAGFIVGGLADEVLSVATGHGQAHYSYLLAEAGTYLGLFLGIVVGIGTGDSSAARMRAVESQKGRTALSSDGVRVRLMGRVKQAKSGEDQTRAGDSRRPTRPRSRA
jgi:hypothetical protein